MDESTLNILRLYSERDSLSLHDLSVLMNCSVTAFSSQVRWLFENGYLEVSYCFSGVKSEYTVSTKLRITQDGRNYLSQHRMQIRNHRINEMRAWITLGIAAAAFILSVINSVSIYL